MTFGPFNKKGFVLLSVTMLSVIFIIIAIPLISWTVHEFSWTTRSFMSLRALNLADAGAEAAIWEIIYNNEQFTGWGGIDPKTTIIYSFTDNAGQVIGDISVSAQNLSPGTWLITSIGFVPSIASPTVKKTIKVKAFPHPLFNNCLFGTSSVTMSGNGIVDSYNSSIAPYSLATAGSNGDVGTNGTLTLSGGASVHGDVLIGPDGSTSGVSQTNVTGEVFYSGNDVELPPILLPSYFSGIPNSGNLYLPQGKDTTMTIPTGNYYYNNISLSGQAELTISANTHLYVNNDFTTSGQSIIYTYPGVEIYIGGDGNFSGQGIINTSGIPSNLQIYGLGSDTSISYSGQNDFYGTIYAPEVSISLSGNAAFFGAIVGETIDISGNGSFHYDEALSQNGPFSGYDIAYWQED